MPLLILVLALVILGPVRAAAALPPTECSEVQPADALQGIVLGPDQPHPVAASVNTIVVKNFDCEPIANAFVEVSLTGANTTCPGATLSGTTDGNGVLTITLSGGGCTTGQPFAVAIKANGVTIRAYDNAKSVDFDGNGGDGRVDLSDLVAFSNEFLGTQPSGCHDYDNTGLTDLADLIIFSPTFMNGNNCP